MITLLNAALEDTTVLKVLRSHTLVGGAPIMLSEARLRENPVIIAHQVPTAPVAAQLIMQIIFAQKLIIVQLIKPISPKPALQVTTSAVVEVRHFPSVNDAHRASSAKAHVFNQNLASTVHIAQAALLPLVHVNLAIIAQPWLEDNWLVQLRFTRKGRLLISISIAQTELTVL